MHIAAESFWPFVVVGWVEPWLPEAAHQNRVLGASVTAAAMQFAIGGYGVVIDGIFFPDGAEGMAQMCADRGVSLHYAVLRADRDTCLARIALRLGHEPSNPLAIADLCSRFGDLAEHEANAVDASGSPDDVASAVIAAVAQGTLLVPSA